jgi:hypothetical protein
MMLIICSVRYPSIKPLLTGAATAAICPQPSVRSRSAAVWWMRAVSAKRLATVRIWQANISKTIMRYVRCAMVEVQETGDFELDGVTFPAAEVQLEFMDPADEDGDGGAMFPTGNLVDTLDVPGIGTFSSHDDQCRYSDDFCECRGYRLSGHGIAGCNQWRCGSAGTL